MTSSKDYNPRLLKPIESSALRDHTQLTAADSCYYFDEYQIGKHYSEHDGVSRIKNLKISLSETHRLSHKNRTIRYYGAVVAEAFKATPEKLFFIPAPSSKSLDDPNYDARLSQVLNHAKSINNNIIVLDVFFSKQSRRPLHESAERRDLEKLKESIFVKHEFFETLTRDDCTRVFFFDDMLTTGCTYRACKDIFFQEIRRHTSSPYVEFHGIFLSRRVPPDILDEFDAEEPSL